MKLRSCLSCLFLVLGSFIYAQTVVEITVSGANPIQVLPSSAFNVSVTPMITSGSLPNNSLFCFWRDFFGQESTAVTLNNNIANTISTPSFLHLGYFELVVASNMSNVALSPLLAGNERVFGFVFWDNEIQSTERNPANDSPLGMVQVDVNDSFMNPGWSKTIGIVEPNPSSGTLSWLSGLVDDLESQGYNEVPLVFGDVWDSNDNLPVSASFLNTLSSSMTDYFNEFPSIEVYELGLEENLGAWSPSYYWSNLNSKVQSVRTAANSVNPSIQLGYQIVAAGTGQLSEVETFFQNEASDYFDILALHPYYWQPCPDSYPMPETWMSDFIAGVEALKLQYGKEHLQIWFTEAGEPHHGNPGGLFGYDNGGSFDCVQGKTRYLSALYITRFHATSFANGVEKVFWYNYQDAGNDPVYPEDHFGMIDFWGFPKTAYASYLTMQDHIRDKTYLSSNIQGNLHSYAFENADEISIIAWRSGGSDVITMPLSNLYPSLSETDLLEVNATDGSPIYPITNGNIDIDDYPIFIRINKSGLSSCPQFSLRVFLEGPYSDNGSMTSSLGSILPLIQPFNQSPWVYSGLESTNNVPSTVTDWVLVTARTGTDKVSTISTVAGFLHNDGWITGVDGANICFGDSFSSSDQVYISVYARNHVGVMSASMVGGDLSVIDFTSDVNQIFGGANGVTAVEPGVFALFSGDFNANGQVQNTDYNQLIPQLGLAGYRMGDFNLNGQVQNTDLQENLLPNLGRGAVFDY